MDSINSRDSSTPHRDEITEVLRLVVEHADAYFQQLDDLPVRSKNVEEVAKTFEAKLPEIGAGAARTLLTLIEKAKAASINSGGPRFFHFVIGGTTPAALGADWLTTVLDQVAYAWVSSPLAVQLEVVALAWLKDLFSLPGKWGGIITTGATMANFVGLAAARQWCGEKQGVNVSEDGLASLPKIPVFSNGYIHASAVKCLGMLGIGRGNLKTFSRDAAGRLDLKALQNFLQELKGSPVILIGNAGEVNAGDFDPIDPLADLAEKYNAWLHVDGAFGLFARLSPKSEHLAAGVERAHSVTVDGHKWLNVPYDCGFAFVRDPALLGRTFAYTADYLPDPEDPHPNMGTIGPESSRRARSLSVWATLQAYGRQGYQAIVENHLALARGMAWLVDAAPDLELLAEVQLNIVCFRYNPGNLSEARLNQLNEQLGGVILEDGRVYAGTTRFENKVALRPAIANWRIREKDIDLFIDVVRELGKKLES